MSNLSIGLKNSGSGTIQREEVTSKGPLKDSLIVLAEFLQTFEKKQHQAVSLLTRNSVETKATMIVDHCDTPSDGGILVVKTIVTTSTRYRPETEEQSSAQLLIVPATTINIELIMRKFYRIMYSYKATVYLVDDHLEFSWPNIDPQENILEKRGAFMMSLLLKTRDHLNDVFSEFRRYIAPAYYHDRCERSLHMNIYAMHKREILLSLACFTSAFILLLFVGLAGPNVVKLDILKASQIFEKEKITNTSVQQNLLLSGPFVVNVPEMSSFSNRICLWVTFFIKGEPDSGAFQRQFAIAISIKGKIANQTKPVLHGVPADQGVSRFHHLSCNGNNCEPIQALHLEYLEFPNYEIEIRFRDLEHFNQKNPISDIHFTFQSINPSFTSLTIWFRFIFLVVTFIITCWFTHSLFRYNFIDWSMEQKWTSYLLICLILYDNPLYPLMYLYESNFPHIIEIFFQSTFLCSVLFFYLAFFHGIRQNNRSFLRFYAPKLVILGFLWLIIFYGASWSITQRMEHPTLDESETYQESITLRVMNFFFYVFTILYFLYLSILLLTAFTELRAMPYFDLRLKLQAFLLSFNSTVCALVVILSRSSFSNSSSVIGENEFTSIPYLQLLPFTYQTSSSTSFLSLFSMANLYIYCCAFFYYPSSTSLMDSRVIRDNPTLSMLNDSDEDVIYGSDVENVNHPKLLEMGDDDDSD